MGFLDFLFGSDKDDRKRIFISFAIEDAEYRDHLVDQARDHRSPFDFIDMSVKRAWVQEEWQKKCRTKIRRCHGVIVLLSSKTYFSKGARWEIKCAKEERIPIAGMYIFKKEKPPTPPELQGKKIIYWSWDNLEKIIDSM